MKIEKSDYPKYAKTVIVKVASYSAAATATSLILANTPVKKPYQKVVIWIGAYVISELIAQRVEKYVVAEVDSVIASYEAVKTNFKTQKTL
jgi:hypothetical protein